MGVIQHLPSPSWHSLKLVLLLTIGTLGVTFCPVAPPAWGHCGSYVLWSGSGRIDLADYAGRPFGRGMLREGLPAQLATQAVSLLEMQREARDARQAGYDWRPNQQPVAPCQGPACGERPLPLDSLPLSLPGFSTSDNWLSDCQPIPFPEAVSERSPGGIRFEIPWGDWPRLVRPPDLFTI